MIDTKAPPLEFCRKCLHRLRKRSARRAAVAAEVLERVNPGHVSPTGCLKVCDKKRVALRMGAQCIRAWKVSKDAAKSHKRLSRLVHSAPRDQS